MPVWTALIAFTVLGEIMERCAPVSIKAPNEVGGGGGGSGGPSTGCGTGTEHSHDDQHLIVLDLVREGRHETTK